MNPEHQFEEVKITTTTLDRLGARWQDMLDSMDDDERAQAQAAMDGLAKRMADQAVRRIDAMMLGVLGLQPQLDGAQPVIVPGAIVIDVEQRDAAH